MRKSKIVGGLVIVGALSLATSIFARIALVETLKSAQEPVYWPQNCMFYGDTGGQFPSSDQGFFETLSALDCPIYSYKLPGYRATDVLELRFLIYWDWRGGIGGSVVGVCQRSRTAELKDEIPSGNYKCYFPDPNWNTEQFDKARKR